MHVKLCSVGFFLIATVFCTFSFLVPILANISLFLSHWHSRINLYYISDLLQEIWSDDGTVNILFLTLWRQCCRRHWRQTKMASIVRRIFARCEENDQNQIIEKSESGSTSTKKATKLTISLFAALIVTSWMLGMKARVVCQRPQSRSCKIILLSSGPWRESCTWKPLCWHINSGFSLTSNPLSNKCQHQGAIFHRIEQVFQRYDWV